MTGLLILHCTLPYSTSGTSYSAPSPDPSKMVELLPSPSSSPWVCYIELAVLSLILRWDKVPIIITLLNVFFESKPVVPSLSSFVSIIFILARLTGTKTLAHLLPPPISYLSCPIFSPWGTLRALLRTLYRRP